jgi:glucan phosphoethanolaminetransferase (alkaline phosphatase superfamily)
MKKIELNVNVLFYLVLLQYSFRFINELQMFTYQLFGIKVNLFYPMITVIANLLVAFLLFKLLKIKSKLGKWIMPILSILLGVYFFFVNQFNIVTILDGDLEYFDLLVNSDEHRFSIYSERVLLILTYLLFLIFGEKILNKWATQ